MEIKPIGASNRLFYYVWGGENSAFDNPLTMTCCESLLLKPWGISLNLRFARLSTRELYGLCLTSVLSQSGPPIAPHSVTEPMKPQATPLYSALQSRASASHIFTVLGIFTESGDSFGLCFSTMLPEKDLTFRRMNLSARSLTLIWMNLRNWIPIGNSVRQIRRPVPPPLFPLLPYPKSPILWRKPIAPYMSSAVPSINSWRRPKFVKLQ